LTLFLVVGVCSVWRSGYFDLLAVEGAVGVRGDLLVGALDGKQESLANEVAAEDEVKVVLTGDLWSETDDIGGIRATHDVALQRRLTGVIRMDDEVLLREEEDERRSEREKGGKGKRRRRRP